MKENDEEMKINLVVMNPYCDFCITCECVLQVGDVVICDLAHSRLQENKITRILQCSTTYRRS